MQADRDRQKRFMPILKRKPMNFKSEDEGMHLKSRLGRVADEPLSRPLDGFLDDKLHFVEEPVEIVGREVKRLKRSRIPLVKVRWNSKRGPEFTWEREDQFKKKYPHLFTKTTPSSSAASGPILGGRSSGTTLSRLCAGPEEPEQAPPSPDYVLGPGHDDDEIVAEDQPYAEDASPIVQSPDYVPETDPEADPEEDGDKDPEEDPIDYPADGGDDGDDEMDIEEDEDDEMDIEIDEEAEEEHLAPAYPVVVVLTATAPSAEETKPFETDESAATPPPHPAYRITARITIPEPLSVPAWSDSEVARLLAISSPPASPLSSWSSSPPQIPFLLSPPSPVLTAPPPSPIRSLGYRAATSAPPPFPTSAPTSFPPLSLPSDSHREGRPEVNLPPRMDEIVETLQGAPVSTDTELGAYVREFESMVRRDTDEIYTMLDDEQSQRQLLAGQVNMLFRDKRAHAYTRHLMETEVRMSREAWGRSMDATADYSDIDCYADTTERDDSTLGTGHHTAGAGDSLTGTGDGITG
ncbi:hypothetical protein Tco_1227270, partial [Tanacetum coccineum]